jgi:hypothetical protein
VIVEKYEVQRRVWCSEEAQEPYRGCHWKNIRNGWGSSFLEVKQTVGGLSPTLCSSRLGTNPAFAFGMTCGAKKWL